MRREGRERENKIIRRKRGRGRFACEICFQKVIPPTLPASPTLVSGQAWFPVFPPPSPTHNDNDSDNDNVLFGVLYSPRYIDFIQII